MDTTQTDVSDLLAQVHEAEAALWVRLALESRADGWFLSFAEVLVDVGLAEGRLWDAGDLVLVEEQVAPGVVEAVLLGSGFELDGRTILPVQRRPQAIREWVPSGRRYGGVRLAYPAFRFALDPEDTPDGAGQPSGLFVNRSGPSFATRVMALSAFFQHGSDAAWNQRPGSLTAWVADSRAWIRHVSIGDGRVTVDLAGDEVSGLTIQLSSGLHEESRTVEAPGAVTFTVATLDRETLVLLTDPIVRDLRSISTMGGLRSEDDTVSWHEPDVQLDALRFGGESEFVEFKSVMPTPKSKVGVLKAIPAFANGQGGTLLIGIDDDNSVVGLGDLTTDEVKDRLTRMIHDSVVPIPAFRVECLELDGLLVAIVEVGPGADKPYALSGNPPAFFARHGSNSFPATREEILAWTAPPSPLGRYGMR